LAESDALVVNSKKFREASMAYPAAATLGRAFGFFSLLISLDMGMDQYLLIPFLGG